MEKYEDGKILEFHFGKSGELLINGELSETQSENLRIGSSLEI